MVLINMVRPNKKKIQKMKADDRVIEKLDELEKEEKKLKKGESKLSHWIKKKLVRKKRVKDLAEEAKEEATEVRKESRVKRRKKK